MLKILFTGLVVFNAATTYAQSYEGTIAYRKTQQSVAVIQLPCSRTAVEEGLSRYMAGKGAKSSGMKNFTVFRSVRLSDADTVLSDLYFTAEPKSRQEKEVTLLTLLPVKKNQDILARTDGDKALLTEARSFLDSLAPSLEAYGISLQEKDQEALLQKARKKMDGLINDQADLDKKIRRLEEDLERNKKDQAKEATDLKVNISANDDDKNKNQRKLRKLLDDEGDLQKKLRKAKSDLDQNRIDQRQQQAEVDRQQQSLDGIKARQSR